MSSLDPSLDASVDPVSDQTESSRATTTHVRGSSALMVGKLLNMVLALVLQVLLVRALSRTDFGAFGYALSIASMTMIVVALGTTKATPRFLAIYEERGDRSRFVGTLVFEFWLVCGLGLAAFVGLLAARGLIEGRLVDDETAFTLTAILILTAPQEAIDKVFEAFAAVKGHTRAIFIRKHVLDPLLRLAAVALLIVLDATVTFLAIGYVVAGVIGTVIYLQLVVVQLRADGLLGHFRPGRFQTPGREMVAFSVPILIHDLVFVGISTLGVIIIGRTHGTAEVAGYRAAYTVARMNQVVGFTFAVLYMPLAARTFARGDVPGMRHAYWRSSAWLTVLTLPMFLLTGPFAGSLTSTLFGDEYRDAAPVLALLASGYYLNMSLGFNTLTLQTFGRLKFTVAVDVCSIAVFWVLALAIIPPHGARGAAGAAAIALAVLNLGSQIGVWRMGLSFFDRTYASVYLSVGAAIGACWALAWATDPPLPVAVVVVGAVSLIVLWIARQRLEVITTFPEIARIPILRSMFR